MAITITGGKYAAASVASVGTTTVTVTTTPFVSGDFVVARRADLYSAGTAQLVATSTFTEDTNWTKGSGVTISGGAANMTGAATMLTQNATLSAGVTYTCRIALNMTSGQKIAFSNSLVDGTTQKYESAKLPIGFVTLEFTFAASGNGIVIGARESTFSGNIYTVQIFQTPPQYATFRKRKARRQRVSP